MPDCVCVVLVGCVHTAMCAWYWWAVFTLPCVRGTDGLCSHCHVCLVLVGCVHTAMCAWYWWAVFTLPCVLGTDGLCSHCHVCLVLMGCVHTAMCAWYWWIVFTLPCVRGTDGLCSHCHVCVVLMGCVHTAMCAFSFCGQFHETIQEMVWVVMCFAHRRSVVASTPFSCFGRHIWLFRPAVPVGHFRDFFAVLKQC
jgi:hypothetical protein